MNRKEPIGQEFCRGSIRIDRSHDPSTSHSPNTSQGSIDPMAPAHGIKPAFCSLLSVPLKGLWWWKGLEGLTQRSALCRWKTKQRKRWSAGQLGSWGCLQRVWTFPSAPQSSHIPICPPTPLSFFPFLYSQKERQMLFNEHWESHEKSPFLHLCTSMDQSSAPP